MGSLLQLLVNPPVFRGLPGGQHQQQVESSGEEGEHKRGQTQPQQTVEVPAVPEDVVFSGEANVKDDDQEGQPAGGNHGHAVVKTGPAETSITEVEHQIEPLQAVRHSVACNILCVRLLFIIRRHFTYGDTNVNYKNFKKCQFEESVHNHSGAVFSPR